MLPELDPEFKRILANYKRFPGKRIYAVYDSLNNKADKSARILKTSNIMGFSYKRVYRAIKSDSERRIEEVRLIFPKISKGEKKIYNQLITQARTRLT
jgi:hypothetical protein